MKFALIDGYVSTPQPRLRATCRVCGSEVIAKCGEVKQWHWAHKAKSDCDHWWENETPWHREWKEHFPLEWQETILRAESGEKHVADVRTESGWIIEFQNSNISPEELRSREAFYGSRLVWIVNGLARKRDREQFDEVLKSSKQVPNHPVVIINFPEESGLLRRWSKSRAPVMFDFGNDRLWCVAPKQGDRDYTTVWLVSKRDFISNHQQGTYNFVPVSLDRPKPLPPSPRSFSPGSFAAYSARKKANRFRKRL